MALQLAETEKELVDLIRRCMTMKVTQTACRNGPKLQPMKTKADMKNVDDADVLSVTTVKYLITHIFRHLHRMKYSVSIYTDILRLSAEFDFLQRYGCWHCFHTRIKQEKAYENA